MYTTITKVENYLITNIDLGFQSQVEDYIEAVTRDIDNYTKRSFTSTTETRYFDGDNTREMRIDDALAITTLELSSEYYGDTFNEETDYITIPANELPITRIHLKDNWFYNGIQNVKITADWGYSSTTPEDIEFAATVMVGMIINHQMNNDGKTGESIGDYKVSFGDNKQEKDYQKAISILDSYKRYYL